MATRRPKIHHGIAILPLVWALAWGVGGCTGPAATVESDGSAAAADVSDADAADAAASDANGSNDVFADSDAGDAFLGSDSTATADSDGGDGQADATSCACGDQICDAQCAENPATCPADCAGCGDGVCAPGEGPVSSRHGKFRRRRTTFLAGWRPTTRSTGRLSRQTPRQCAHARLR